jgi:hypothetical protein
MITAYGGANADVGLVTRAEQPRTHPIKKAILRRLGRLLKPNFQLTFKLRRAPQTLENEATFGQDDLKAHQTYSSDPFDLFGTSLSISSGGNGMCRTTKRHGGRCMVGRWKLPLEWSAAEG